MKKCPGCGNLIAVNFAKCPICNSDQPAIESEPKHKNGAKTWFMIGIAFIGAAIIANAALPQTSNQGEQLGRGIVTLAACLCGIAFLVVGVVATVRKKR
jgi:hypothetical protein